MAAVVIVLPSALLAELQMLAPPVRAGTVLRGAVRPSGSLSGTARTPGRLGGAS